MIELLLTINLIMFMIYFAIQIKYELGVKEIRHIELQTPFTAYEKVKEKPFEVCNEDLPFIRKLAENGEVVIYCKNIEEMQEAEKIESLYKRKKRRTVISYEEFINKILEDRSERNK